MKSRQLPDGLCEACFKESGGAVPCPQCGYDPRRPIEDWSKLPPGFTLENRFVVGRALGQGGFGITYLAYDSSLSFRVALKEYFPRGLSTRHHTACSVLCSQPDEKENFEYGKKKFIEEARSAAQFDNHPNIAIVRDFFETNGTAYIVMNYYEGTDFMHYLKTFGNKVSFPEAMRYLSPVMKALDDIHARGIVHRDVSPDNIFITSDGGVRLLDFGAAKSVFAARVSHSVPIGKEGYCPPEQMTGKEIGPWTDVYGMAATLYRALTGEVPASLGERWENENALPPPSARGARVSKDVDAAILRGLSLKRQDRWQSMFAFEEALKGPDS
ncbi:MAG: serine/threonine protein kinase, partial [Synergistaceae bacterium]|nr:serine/threonine protein kinase [Synergistaceae bacterium]